VLCPFWRNIKNATGIQKIVFDNVVTKFEDAQFAAARLFICTPRQIPVRRLNRKWDGWACSIYGEKSNLYRTLIVKPEEKGLLERPRRRWVDNIKMDIKEIGWEDMVCVYTHTHTDTNVHAYKHINTHKSIH